MEAERSRNLLLDASTLIRATRSCISRSMTLLAPVTLDAVGASPEDKVSAPLRTRNSSHPPSSSAV